MMLMTIYCGSLLHDTTPEYVAITVVYRRLLLDVQCLYHIFTTPCVGPKQSPQSNVTCDQMEQVTGDCYKSPEPAMGL